MTLQPIFDYKILLKSLFRKKIYSNKVFVKSGRLAFNHIINTIKASDKKIKKVILPNLICDEMVMVVKSQKIDIEYYNVDDKLNYSISEIEDISDDGANIIVFVNYFGFESNHSITDKLKNNIIVEDNAHVLTAINNSASSFADYSFSSYRKLLPVLSGAEINSNNNLDLMNSSRFPDFGELIYSLRNLKKNRSGVSRMGHDSYKSNFNLSYIDVFSKTILERYNFAYDEIITNRRHNFKFWEQYLSNKDLVFMKSIDSNVGICPYAFPCYVIDENDINKWIQWGKLHNLTIIQWPKYHENTLKYIPDNFLKRILLFPVNHQFDLTEIFS